MRFHHYDAPPSKEDKTVLPGARSTLLRGMNRGHMYLQVNLLPKPSRTGGALERFLACVDSQMDGQLLPLHEFLLAIRARELPAFGMLIGEVLLQESSSGRREITVGATF